MPITPTTLAAPAYTKHLPRVVVTLADILGNQLAPLQTGARGSRLAALDPNQELQGLEVSLGLFPSVLVAPGVIVDPTGEIHTFLEGSLALPPVADAIYWVYVDSAFNVTAGTSVPGSAAFVLAKVTMDHVAASFTLVTSVTTQTPTYDGNDGLLQVLFQSGSITTRTITYTVDGNGDALTSTEVFADRTYYRVFNRDGTTGEITSTTITRLS